MSEMFSPSEAARLRRLVDPPSTSPGYERIDFAAEHEKRRLERVAAAEQARRDEAQRVRQAEEAERRRREENAPRIAAIDQRVASLRAEREPIEAAYRRAVAPIDEELRTLRAEREALS